VLHLLTVALPLALNLTLTLALALALALSLTLTSCKPSGSILLLEHGVSSWDLIARWQRHRLNRQVVRWGCYWDRDILACVEAAGLRVVELRRTNCDTILFIRCQRPDAPPD